MMKGRRLVRRATLNGYAEAATEAGLDAHAMLEEVGLAGTGLNDSDELISFDAFLKLLSLSAQRSGLMDFGIRAAHARGIPDLGAVSLLMREAENVEAAIRLYTSHLRLHSDGTLVYLQTGFDFPVIAVEMSGNSMMESMQVTQFGTTGILKQIRWLIGEDYRPELVTFAFPNLPSSQFARHVFQCEVLHNQSLSGMVLDQAVLRRPLITSPPFLRKLAIEQLQPLLRRGQDTITMRVARMIGQRLEDGDFSSQAIADDLGIDRRTLNRRLTREGATYQTILQDERLLIAERVLSNSDQSLTELSCALGFQSLSACSRWFQNNFGRSASEMRKEHGSIGTANLLADQRARNRR